MIAIDQLGSRFSGAAGSMILETTAATRDTTAQRSHTRISGGRIVYEPSAFST